MATELPKIPFEADERTMLLAFLDYYRAALRERCAGLTPEQFRATHGPTTLTLIRLIGHMAYVEGHWFRVVLHGLDHVDELKDLDWAADQDAEMTMVESWEDAAVFDLYDRAIADADERMADVPLDAVGVKPSRSGENISLRWILVHMIEEYARHCGHADLIRESIDGTQAP